MGTPPSEAPQDDRVVRIRQHGENLKFARSGIQPCPCMLPKGAGLLAGDV